MEQGCLFTHDTDFPLFYVCSVQVILMDHVDWLDMATAQELATTLAQQVATGGIVIWRSAALEPPYADLIRDAGFDVKCIR